jgi:hypothetical protein
MPARTKKTDKTDEAAAPAVAVALATFDDCGSRPVYRRLRGGAIGSFADVAAEEYRPFGRTPLRDATASFIADLDGLRDPEKVTVGLLLDESGSMLSKQAAVIQGVNEFVAGLRAEEDVDPEAAGKVLAVISTDGIENASRHVSPEALQDLIREREADGWTFIYLGANQDAWAVGTSYGLSGTASGQTISTADTVTGTRSAFREAGLRGVGYLKDNAAFASTYSAQMANTVLSEDGEVTAALPKDEGPKVEPYGDVEDALLRAAEATRSPGAS